MAIMQSVIEELSQSIGGRRSDVPVAVHDACIAVGKALLESGLSMSGEATVGGLLGYPMAVIYSYLLNFKAFRDFVGASKALLMFPVAWKLMSSFADVVAVQGYASAEARAFYAANIYTFGEHSKPLTDPGWAQQFLGTIGTYTARLGRHCYRKVPTVSGAYNMSYAVHPLADEKLRIGILADWATGAPGSMRVLEELAKLKPDIVIHLGDTYYSGTLTEQRDFLHDPLRAHLGEQVPVYLIPGNHDYYASGGEGFFQIVDEFGAQEASFFALRGKTWQIIGVDTGILDNQQFTSTLLPFLPDDQHAWATNLLLEGQRLGLKTIFMSHHQWFTRTNTLGKANSKASEILTWPDRDPLDPVYTTGEWKINSTMLPGGLRNDQPPAVNTRLLNQFPPELREYVTVYYWGHEHSSAVFDKYCNISRGRLIGNGAIAETIDYDQYVLNPKNVYSPWGKPPPLLSQAAGCVRAGCRTGQGSAGFWDVGFVTVDIDGPLATARHWELQHNSSFDPHRPGSNWGDAAVFFQESF